MDRRKFLRQALLAITAGVVITSTGNPFAVLPGYVPRTTNTTNVAASTARLVQYHRNGNVVTVLGQIDLDPSFHGPLPALQL